MMHRFGAYELQRRIGVGGMAEIWLAIRRGPHGFARQVALKRILPAHATDEAFVRSFLQEARLLSQLSHPNVVQVHEAGDVDGTWYLTMEYVHGADLRTLLQRFRRQRRYPPLAFTLNVVADLCAALEHVHGATDDRGRSLGLIHRDVSPHNLLVSLEGVVKLTDFGIAKALDQEHKTATGILKGKIAYMAPEQVRGVPVDPRTDLFQAGIVFYECLTLAHPFLGGATGETLARILAGKTTRPRTRRPEVPQVVEDVLRDALRPRPDDRFPAASVMRRACEAALATLELPRGPGPIRAQMSLLFPELKSRRRPATPPPIPPEALSAPTRDEVRPRRPGAPPPGTPGERH